MLPRTPEEWPGLFERYLNAGDLDAVASLYDPDAVFVPKSGETVCGRNAIRGMLSLRERPNTEVAPVARRPGECPTSCPRRVSGTDSARE